MQGAGQRVLVAACLCILLCCEASLATTPAPTAAEREKQGLVLGVGWGLFAVLFLAALSVVVTIAAAVALPSRWVPAVGGVCLVVTVVFLIILTQCPTYTEQREEDSKGTKVDGTHRFRNALLGLVPVGLFFAAAATAYFHFTDDRPFVPRPKRGPQTYRRYKENCHAALR
eukprot:Rhum_TRINITY_DN7301_c0_g2::Rhum_TRINITY_DN7301_c0_g2_i1::g.22460::m.22460